MLHNINTPLFELTNSIPGVQMFCINEGFGKSGTTLIPFPIMIRKASDVNPFVNSCFYSITTRDGFQESLILLSSAPMTSIEWSFVRLLCKDSSRPRSE